MSEPNFFSTGSPFLDHPLLTPERTAIEVDFVLAQTKLSVDERILDIGCGPGRHTIELARRGYQVVGIDPSAAMIEAAKERTAQVGVQPKLWQASGEEFSAVRKFEAAICLFTTLGQINTEDKKPQFTPDHPLLNQVAKVLVPGGTFILEVPQKGWVINNLKTMDRFGDDFRYTDIQRVYDPGHSIVTETFTLVSPEKTRQYLLRYRLYDLQQVHAMLQYAGFEMIQTYGDFHQAPLIATSPNMIAVTRRMPDA